VNAPVVEVANIEKHLNYLCQSIGNRLAGTEGEAKAAEYMASQFAALGLQVEVQEFPSVCWSCEEADLRARVNGRWQAVPVQPNTQSPATDGALEAELVYLETAQVQDCEGLDLTGKVGLLFGSAYASVERLERLCNSGLAALLYVDERFPTRWNVASGLIAGWIDLMTIPTATIPYLHAWDLVRAGCDRVRLRIDMTTFQSTSQNVVATLPGGSEGKPLAIGAHHDSVCLGVGADDDACGSAIILDLARALAGADRVRPIRFISFGWEENLSEGSRHYVVNPANRAQDTAFMINIDSGGSWLGMNKILCTGDRALRKFVSDHARRQRFTAEIMGDISPWSDHFPFNLAGVPTMWLYRTNFPGGRWYHHSEHETLETVDCRRLAHLGRVAGGILADLESRKRLPFPRAIPAAQQRAIARWRKELYDCICDWRTPGLMRPEGKPWREF